VPAYQQAIADGLGGRVDFVTSASGGFRDSDSLLVVVDADRFTIEDVIELHRYRGIAANFNVMDETSFEHGALRARSPLAVRLRERDGQRTFWVIANHLARGEADLRIDQARLLRQWAEDHDGAIVAVGDFNFDWDIPTRRGNAAFDAMLEGDVWEWLEPESLVDTNWTNDRQNPGHDRYPDSILDFVFVAKAARDWRGESRVVVRPGDFPDDETTSDHRPVLATLRPPAE
jgi:endonuclease/exonuclease/phosphatase family metal-dependent hydrolase